MKYAGLESAEIGLILGSNLMGNLSHAHVSVDYHRSTSFFPIS
uniref:Uncharacterized protein n=1 Tax=Arundo donax TaxID=35708 RepID=A0A0A9GN25_ARUDO